MAEPFGLPDQACTTDIFVQDFWDVKRAALQCHATQLKPDSLFAALPAEIMRELQSWECFQLASVASPGPSYSAAQGAAALAEQAESAVGGMRASTTCLLVSADPCSAQPGASDRPIHLSSQASPPCPSGGPEQCIDLAGPGLTTSEVVIEPERVVFPSHDTEWLLVGQRRRDRRQRADLLLGAEQQRFKIQHFSEQFDRFYT